MVPRSGTALVRWAPVVIVTYVLTHCGLVCARRPFWMDELVTNLLATDPSLPHALQALAHGADGGGPVTFLLAWLAGQLGISGELGFRLLSSGYMAVGLIALLGALRRGFGTGPALLATGWTMCGSTLVLYQNSEFRFYALLFGLTALTVNRYAHYFVGQRRQLWVYAGLHALLVLTHPFGLFYSGALGVAALLSGWRRRMRVWPLALAGAAGAAIFGLWMPAFLRQATVLVADSYLPRPGLADLTRVYLQVAPLVHYDEQTKVLVASFPRPLMAGILTCLGLVGLLGVTWWWRVVHRLRVACEPTGTAAAVIVDPPVQTALLFLAALLVLVPAGGWVLARVGRPVFLHRYFIPSALGFAILYTKAFALLAARGVGRWHQRGATSRVVALITGGFFMAWPLLSAARLPDGFTVLRTRLTQLAQGDLGKLPVVCSSPHQYWPMSYYSQNSRFWFVIDQEVAFTLNGGTAATEFNFTSVQASFYPHMRVASTVEFLREHPRFLVDDERAPWFERRVKGDPARFRVERPNGLPENAVLVTSVPPSTF